MVEERKNLLVTGCSGRLGANILKTFAKDYRVIGLDLTKPEESGLVEDYFYIDLTSDDSVQSVLKHVREIYGTKVASVIHLAAYYSFSHQEWKLYREVTIEGTKRLMEGLKHFEIEQFIFSSTQLVYKTCPLDERISEDSPLKPEWEYPQSKVITEQEILKSHGDVPVCIMRIAGVYDDECHSIPLAHQIQRIYENHFEKRFFPGNIRHGAPFLHMDDLMDCLQRTVQRRALLPNELILLVGEDKTYSYDAIQRKLSQLILGKEFTTYRIPKVVAKAGAWLKQLYSKPFIKPWMIDISDDHYELDISRSKALLDWQPQRDLMETLPLMVEDLKRDPSRWYEENGLKKPS